MPLVILHGLFGSSDNWMSVARKLGEQFTVYLPDQRNHGLSGKSDTWNYQAMAEDLQQFVTEEQIEQPVIIGHSMGGKVAMKFAGLFPEKLRKLVVADIAPRPYPVHHQVILQGLQAVKPHELKSRRDADLRLAEHVKELPVRQFLLKNLYRDNSGSFGWRVNLEVISQQIENVGEEIRYESPFEKPALFIRGENSQYIRDEDIPEIKKQFARAEVKNIAEAGHWIHAEQPERFLQILYSFI